MRTSASIVPSVAPLPTWTSAPEGTRPTVRWLTWTLLLPVPPPKPPIDSGPCASATISPFDPRSGEGSSVPPWRLRASPTDETVTSRRAPARAYGGSSVVTSTEAMFSTLICSAGTETPKRSSMFASVWAEKIVWRLSPVLFSPMTRPYPIERRRTGALQRRDVLEPRRPLGVPRGGEQDGGGRRRGDAGRDVRTSKHSHDG